MAYEVTEDEDDENGNEAEENLAEQITPAAGVLTPDASQAVPQNDRSNQIGGFPTLQKYLAVNQDQSGQVAKLAGAPIEGRLSSITQQVSQLPQSYQADVQAGAPSLAPQDFSQLQARNYTPELQQKVKTLGNSSYSGPMDPTNYFQPTRFDVNDLQTQVKDLDTEAGRYRQLRSVANRPDYTLGQQKLDELLFRAPQGQEYLTNLKTQAFPQLQSALQQQEQNFQGAVDQRKNVLQGEKSQARDLLNEEAAALRARAEAERANRPASQRTAAKNLLSQAFSVGDDRSEDIRNLLYGGQDMSTSEFGNRLRTMDVFMDPSEFGNFLVDPQGENLVTPYQYSSDPDVEALKAIGNMSFEGVNAPTATELQYAGQYPESVRLDRQAMKEDAYTRLQNYLREGADPKAMDNEFIGIGLEDPMGNAIRTEEWIRKAYPVIQKEIDARKKYHIGDNLLSPIEGLLNYSGEQYTAPFLRQQMANAQERRVSDFLHGLPTDRTSGTLSADQLRYGFGDAIEVPGTANNIPPLTPEEEEEQGGWMFDPGTGVG